MTSDGCDQEVLLFSVRNLSASRRNAQFPAPVYCCCKGEKSKRVRKKLRLSLNVAFFSKDYSAFLKIILIISV